MPDDMYVKRPPYQAPKGRWGDTIPKMTYLQWHDLSCPYYDTDNNCCPEKCCQSCPVAGWYTKGECKEMGVSLAGRAFVHPEASFGQSISAPVRNAKATEHNHTPRQHSTLLWTQKAVSSLAFTEEYGEEAAAKIAVPTDGLPFDNKLLTEAIRVRINQTIKRMPRRFL
jgi:hypothetical protein